MNEKTKKTLKKAGIIAGCMLGGAGLMYAGYLCGEFLPTKGTTVVILPPRHADAVFELGVKTPLMPGKWCSAIDFPKESAVELVKSVNSLLQEVV